MNYGTHSVLGDRKVEKGGKKKVINREVITRARQRTKDKMVKETIKKIKTIRKTAQKTT